MNNYRVKNYSPDEVFRGCLWQRLMGAVVVSQVKMKTHSPIQNRSGYKLRIKTEKHQKHTYDF